MTWFGWFLMVCYVLTAVGSADGKNRAAAVLVIAGVLFVGTGTGL